MKEQDIIGANGEVTFSEKDFLLLAKYLEEIRFGSVTLNIREGRVVGIEKNEKIRLE